MRPGVSLSFGGLPCSKHKQTSDVAMHSRPCLICQDSTDKQRQTGQPVQ